MPNEFSITAEIGIDMAHRVPLHASKCRNLHGHRYRIEATVTGTLVDTGPESGMVMDFAFLKKDMMRAIDEPFDHGTALWENDRLLMVLCNGGGNPHGDLSLSWDTALNRLRRDGVAYRSLPDADLGEFPEFDYGVNKVIAMRDYPTAENLAAVWFNSLAGEVMRSTDGAAKLVSLRVWETPNFSCVYPAR